MRAWLVVCVLLTAPPAAAQSLDARTRDALAWKMPTRADWISYGTVATELTTSCVGAIKPLYSSRADCWKWEGIRVGTAVGLSELAKRLVQRQRPDGSDDKSFYSMHTSICFAAFSGKRRWLNAALCGGTAYLRVAGKKHWLSDVAMGTAAGFTIAALEKP